MKKLRLVTLLAAIVVALAAMTAQAQNPVTWTAKVEMATATEGTVLLTADIAEGWHIYGTEAVEGGPIPTTLTFGGTGIEYCHCTCGCCAPSPDPVTQMDPVYECEVSYWEGKVTFTRNFTITDPDNAAVEVSARYMCCNDMNCMPPKTVTLTPTIK